MATIRHQYVITDTDGNFYFHIPSDGKDGYTTAFLYGNTEEDPTNYVSEFFKIPQSAVVQRLGDIPGSTITTVLISPEQGDDLLGLLVTMRRISSEGVMRAVCDKEITDLSSLAVIAVISAHGAVKALDGA